MLQELRVSSVGAPFGLPVIARKRRRVLHAADEDTTLIDFAIVAPAAQPNCAGASISDVSALRRKPTTQAATDAAATAAAREPSLSDTDRETIADIVGAPLTSMHRAAFSPIAVVQ